MLTRRHALSTLLSAPLLAQPTPSRPTLCVFSKHLADVPVPQLGRVAKELGFEGVDLTVRPGGHVLPEKVATDLAPAVEAIRSAGLSVPMITTNLLTPVEAPARPTLKAAGSLRVPFFKPGYWRYKSPNVEATLAEAKAATIGLARLAEEHGVVMGVHNHSGEYVGTAVWDTREMIRDLNPRTVGYYYDPCHATAEGGAFGWQLSLRMAAPRLKMIAIKDFLWEKQNGKWRMRFCPLGEGMVDWPKFAAILKESNFTGPMTVHVEYKNGDEHAALAKDLQFLKKLVGA